MASAGDGDPFDELDLLSISFDLSATCFVRLAGIEGGDGLWLSGLEREQLFSVLLLRLLPPFSNFSPLASATAAAAAAAALRRRYASSRNAVAACSLSAALAALAAAAAASCSARISASISSVFSPAPPFCRLPPGGLVEVKYGLLGLAMKSGAEPTTVATEVEGRSCADL